MNAEIIPGYKIFTDATADFPAGMAAGMPRVEIIPMEVTAGSDSFLYGPGGNLTVAQFYAMQRGGKFATTSQINPAAYVQFFESALKEGFDVLYLCFSSGMSGCFGNARLCMDDLREAYPDRRLICLDTLAAPAGEALLVAEAARRQQEGMMLENLAAWVEEHRLQACHWFSVACFDHLRHVGRISAAAATVGSVLNIKIPSACGRRGHTGRRKKAARRENHPVCAQDSLHFRQLYFRAGARSLYSRFHGLCRHGDLPLSPRVSIGALVMPMAFVPIAGAWMSAIIGAILILATEGFGKALGFVVLIIVIQQIEGNLIYPKVMGKRVAFPPCGYWSPLRWEAASSAYGACYCSCRFLPPLIRCSAALHSRRAWQSASADA